MNKRIALAIIALILGIAIFVLPGVFRLEMVANLGVLTANTATMLAQITSIACVASAGLLAWKPIRRAIANQQATAKELQLRKKPTLPSRDEANFDALEPSLLWATERYPSVANDIHQSIDQLQSLLNDRDLINRFLERNAGLTKDNAADGLAEIEFVINKVAQDACKGLVQIIYQAQADTTPEELRALVHDVIERNQTGVKLTNQLVNVVVRYIPRDTEQEAKQALKEALMELKAIIHQEGY